MEYEQSPRLERVSGFHLEIQTEQLRFAPTAHRFKTFGVSRFFAVSKLIFVVLRYSFQIFEIVQQKFYQL